MRKTAATSVQLWVVLAAVACRSAVIAQNATTAATTTTTTSNPTDNTTGSGSGSSTIVKDEVRPLSRGPINGPIDGPVIGPTNGGKAGTGRKPTYQQTIVQTFMPPFPPFRRRRQMSMRAQPQSSLQEPRVRKTTAFKTFRVAAAPRQQAPKVRSVPVYRSMPVQTTHHTQPLVAAFRTMPVVRAFRTAPVVKAYRAATPIVQASVPAQLMSTVHTALPVVDRQEVVAPDTMAFRTLHAGPPTSTLAFRTLHAGPSASTMAFRTLHAAPLSWTSHKQGGVGKELVGFQRSFVSHEEPDSEQFHQHGPPSNEKGRRFRSSFF